MGFNHISSEKFIMKDDYPAIIVSRFKKAFKT